MDDKDIAIEGLHVIRKDTQIQKEAGLVVYVHETMSVICLTEFEKYGVECIWLEVKLQKTSSVLVGFLYQNPSKPANWTDEFVSMMAVVWLESKEIILMGDFSIDLSKANKPWTDVFSRFNLSQNVSSVASKVIKTDNSPSNELTVLEQYCTEKISHEASALPFITVREVYKSLCHLKQSNTKGTDGLDGKILRLSAPFIAETLTYT